MARGLSPKQLYEKKFKTFDFDGIWKDILGEPERGGYWLIYGLEKNGKSTLALSLAKYLSTLEKVAYISAEEGTDKSFQQRCKRIGINVMDHKFMAYPYDLFEEYLDQFKGRQFPKVVFIDNLTAYDGEIDKKMILQLTRDYPKITFIILAHEERKEPVGAVGRLVKKLSKRIFHVVGLKAIVTNRDGLGGEYLIDDKKGLLYHGTNN
ncbi:hypothetical protein [Empedobacter sp. R132-2]|uniref:hypothetical protein n=1 Tax=Empedobacter sp. R132-2 TaxID=2746740 RepID=UPI0025786D2D|nr:hypothetical protein [Empedobacter sp. R132-2]MDM1138872.1 hypothetical protein [Empedobacter sp. R132-2]